MYILKGQGSIDFAVYEWMQLGHLLDQCFHLGPHQLSYSGRICYSFTQGNLSHYATVKTR